ncbi:MAG: hypothetical protein DRP62_07710 [Planctomycetota bacterium]|nr:MAG: hypothetical protein DRP62_07710 [Planctomycetota bacterium]
MNRRLFWIVGLILLLTLSGRLFAYSSWSGAVDSNWMDPNNWNEGVIPTCDDWTDIPGMPNAPDINVGQDAVCDVLRVSPWGEVGLATVTVSGGTLTCSRDMYISYGAPNHPGEVILNSGEITANRTLVGYTYSFGTLTINGGTFNGGEIGLPCWWAVGDYHVGGYINIRGGVLNCTNLWVDYHGNAESAVINIAGGVLVWTGDHVQTIQDLVGEGHIIGNGGRTGVIVDYNITTPGATTVTAPACDYGDAYAPSPADHGSVPGAERDSTTLTWAPGDYVQEVNEHKVYFSDNFDDVNEANSAVLTVRDVNNYSPGSLMIGQTYYWRVDEVNDANGDIWPGTVWQFTVDPYILVDDFEDYNDATISNTWEPTSIVEELIGRNGSQSMGFYYSGSVTRTFDSSQDWTQAGIKALTLYLYGKRGNTTGTLSVSLEDSDGDTSPSINYPDSNDLLNLSWSEWNINLDDFNVGDMDMDRVKKIKITVSGGGGTLFIDDIRLYASRCVPEFASADVDGDCYTDMYDISAMANGWLHTEYEVTAVAPANGPHVWYKLDDGGGGTAHDDSGNGYDGTVSDGSGNWKTSGGYDDSGCMYFNGDFVVYVDPCAFEPLDPNGGLTFSVWVQGSVNSNYMPPYGSDNHYGIMLHGGSTDWGASTEAFRATIPNVDGSNIIVSFYTRPSVDEGPNLDSVGWYTGNPDDFMGEWVHYAFVKDTPNATMSIYRNGELVAQNENAPLPVGFKRDLTNFKCALGGARADYETTSYRGKIDDFRIYDYALSQGEVLYLSGAASPFTQGLIPPYDALDISDDGKVSFLDYATLADSWLEEEVLWP